ncbi:MAG: DJ-1/PfpI family protein, partial [Candidatus Hydrothermarchaeaceae archaeon]
MEKKVLMVVASQRFRDEELLEPKRVLEERGAKVVIASSSLEPATGMLGAQVSPEVLLGDAKAEDYDAVIFIGGGGAQEYWNDPIAHGLARETVDKNKVLAAICIAPVTLANAGLLAGKKVAVFSSEEDKVESKGAICAGGDVEVDGNIITGEGPQAAEKFA